MNVNNNQLEVVCESCGARFSCCPEPIENCWCASVRIDEESRARLTDQKFAKCVCPTCLAKFATAGASTDSSQPL